MDGGLRRATNLAAIGIAIYGYTNEYVPLSYTGELLTDVHSAFVAEALALDKAITTMKQIG